MKRGKKKEKKKNIDLLYFVLQIVVWLQRKEFSLLTFKKLQLIAVQVAANARCLGSFIRDLIGYRLYIIVIFEYEGTVAKDLSVFHLALGRVG